MDRSSLPSPAALSADVIAIGAWNSRGIFLVSPSLEHLAQSTSYISSSTACQPTTSPIYRPSLQANSYYSLISSQPITRRSCRRSNSKMDSNQQDLVAQFSGITGATPANVSSRSLTILIVRVLGLTYFQGASRPRGSKLESARRRPALLRRARRPAGRGRR